MHSDGLWQVRIDRALEEAWVPVEGLPVVFTVAGLLDGARGVTTGKGVLFEGHHPSQVLWEVKWPGLIFEDSASILLVEPRRVELCP